MKELIIYEKPTCSTCRVGLGILNESGVAFTKVKYYDEPFSHKKLAELIKKMGIKPRELLRTREELYRKLKLDEKNYSDSEFIDLMIKHPDLIQRPILEYGDKAILARPVEKINEFLKEIED